MQNDSKAIIKNKYLSNFPYPTSERSQKFFGVILTLCAISFFGFLAIKPTISTILRLKKEISDSVIVYDKLDIKIKNLSELGKQYTNLKPDISIVTSAITIQPDTHLLLAQIQSIAQSSSITIKKLQNFEVEIIRNNNSGNKNFYSYSFAVAGSGSFENINKFVHTLTDMERVVNIDTFSISNAIGQNTASTEFDIQGTAFFKDSL